MKVRVAVSNAAVFAILLGLPACAADDAMPPTPLAISSVATGDWDDVDAAVDAGVSAAEVAKVDVRSSPDLSTRTYQLRTITDEPAWLIAQRAGTGRVSLGARVGRFGDPERESRLLRAVSERLNALYGVDWAPPSK
jgi:hypothetical protein